VYKASLSCGDTEKISQGQYFLVREWYLDGMDGAITPVFIPGLICTADLFRDQITAVVAFAETQPRIGEPVLADTLAHDSVGAMASSALAQASGPVVAIGLSMGGYVALEMARLAPDRVVGMALLSTGYKQDTADKRHQRLATIKMAQSDKFRGVTHRLLGAFLAPEAMADDALVARVIQMAQDVGRHAFVTQQTAILGRNDQSATLAAFAGEITILCGMLDELTPPHLSQEMAALAPRAELVLVPEIGHLSSLEAPDAVNTAIIDLLARVLAWPTGG
jgi:pimeloyl-ACP methyl ester carboxylesterase